MLKNTNTTYQAVDKTTKQKTFVQLIHTKGSPHYQFFKVEKITGDKLVVKQFNQGTVRNKSYVERYNKRYEFDPNYYFTRVGNEIIISENQLYQWGAENNIKLQEVPQQELIEYNNPTNEIVCIEEGAKKNLSEAENELFKFQAEPNSVLIQPATDRFFYGCLSSCYSVSDSLKMANAIIEKYENVKKMKGLPKAQMLQQEKKEKFFKKALPDLETRMSHVDKPIQSSSPMINVVVDICNTISTLSKSHNGAYLTPITQCAVAYHFQGVDTRNLGVYDPRRVGNVSNAGLGKMEYRPDSEDMRIIETVYRPILSDIEESNKD